MNKCFILLMIIVMHSIQSFCMINEQQVQNEFDKEKLFSACVFYGSETEQIKALIEQLEALNGDFSINIAEMIGEFKAYKKKRKNICTKEDKRLLELCSKNPDEDDLVEIADFNVGYSIWGRSSNSLDMDSFGNTPYKIAKQRK